MFLISETYLKSRVNVSLHKDATAIKIAFQNVTDFYVKDLLGIPLYDLYIDHLVNATPLTVKQAELYDKIKVYFALSTHYELLMNGLVDNNNKGTTEDDRVAALDTVKMVRQDVASKAEQMKSNILKYLEANKADFPQYFSNETKQDAPKLTSGPSPIVFIDEPKIWIGG